jgi:hypothetical protein
LIAVGFDILLDVQAVVQCDWFDMGLRKVNLLSQYGGAMRILHSAGKRVFRASPLRTSGMLISVFGATLGSTGGFG